MPCKRKLLFLCAFLSLIILSGCSKPEKSEAEIVKDLQTSPIFISVDVKISNYEIIKRQTNVDDKTDLVYITVQTNDPKLTSSLTFELKYELYNEGWILESVVRYYDGPWEFSGLGEAQLLADIKDNDYYFSDWDLDVVDIEITEESCDSNAMTYYEKRIVANLTAHNISFDYYTSYNIYYGVVDGNWELQSVEIPSRRYEPTYSPDVTALDRIVEELDLGSGASATKYDGYEYLKTEADWPNCTEVRYYTATKNWWFGTETYLISIPIYFSLERGEDSSRWTYSSNDIKSSIQSVDWNLEGTWVNERDSSEFPYFTVNMKVNSITATDDPETYTVNLSCDAYSNQYSYLCKTYGNVNARIRYSEPGRWLLFIDKGTAEINNDLMWSSFDLIGYSVGFTYEGFFWDYDSRSVTSNGCKLKRTW